MNHENVVLMENGWVSNTKLVNKSHISPQNHKKKKLYTLYYKKILR